LAFLLPSLSSSPHLTYTTLPCIIPWCKGTKRWKSHSGMASLFFKTFCSRRLISLPLLLQDGFFFFFFFFFDSMCLWPDCSRSHASAQRSVECASPPHARNATTTTTVGLSLLTVAAPAHQRNHRGHTLRWFPLYADQHVSPLQGLPSQISKRDRRVRMTNLLVPEYAASFQ
jgi:hypothetical protein